MFKIRSIQISIVLWVALCLLIGMGLLTAYSAVTTRNNTTETAKDALSSEADARAKFIEMEMEIPLDAARTMAQMLSAQIETNQSLSRDEVTALLKGVLEQNPSFFGVTTEWEPDAFDGQDAVFANVGNTDETGHFSPYWYRDGEKIALTFLTRMDENDSAYQYYTVPKKTLVEAVTDPYFYPLGDKEVLMTSFSAPIMVNGKFYGVADVDMTLDFLQEYAEKAVEYHPDAKVLILSYTGTIGGATSQPDMISKPLSDLYPDYKEELSALQAGKDFRNEKNGTIITSAPLMLGQYPKPWALQMTLPKSDILVEADRSMWMMIGIGSGLFVLALILLYFVAGSIARPIRIVTQGAILLSRGDANITGMDKKTITAITRRSDELGEIGKAFHELVGYFNEMAGKAQAIANRDLTVKIEPKGETDILGNTFIKMIDGLRETIQQVQNNANLITEASETLAGTSNQAGQATSQIATTIQQVATGTTQQSEAINRTASSVEQTARAIDGVAQGAQEQAAAAAKASSITGQLSSAIEQVAGNAQAVVENSVKAADAARRGSMTVDQTLNGMQSIKVAVGLSAKKVQEMGNRSDKIGDIVTAIEDIASQTNLLALNAAIEAARAGEAGKGFAVVADEVRKLADRSSSATKEIGGLIKGIQTTVSEAVKAMDDGAREVESGVEFANQAGVALQEILQAAEAVNEQAEEASRAAEKMASSANELVAAVDSVSAVVEENTAATEEMAASSSEVTQAIESIASVSEENSAAVEQVSAAAEEMTAQVEEVSASAQQLASMAEQLRKVVAQFKL